MENESYSKKPEIVYSQKVRAGKRRTYFFDVKRTKGEDYFLTLTESTKKMSGDYERHKIFLYKEDFNRFVQTLEETVQYIKTELMPQYDYDEFARRQDEYEARYAEEKARIATGEAPTTMEDKSTTVASTYTESAPPPPLPTFRAERVEEPQAPPVKKKNEDDDDMSW